MRRWIGYALLAALLLGCGTSTEPVQQTRPLPKHIIPQSKDVPTKSTTASGLTSSACR